MAILYVWWKSSDKYSADKFCYQNRDNSKNTGEDSWTASPETREKKKSCWRSCTNQLAVRLHWAFWHCSSYFWTCLVHVGSALHRSQRWDIPEYFTLHFPCSLLSLSSPPPSHTFLDQLETLHSYYLPSHLNVASFLVVITAIFHHAIL